MFGVTELIIVAKIGDTNIVNLLIANGVDVNAGDEDGWTALMEATKYGDVDTIKLLLK